MSMTLNKVYSPLTIPVKGSIDAELLMGFGDLGLDQEWTYARAEFME